MVMLSAGKEADKLFEDLANAQAPVPFVTKRSEEHTSELQSRE